MDVYFYKGAKNVVETIPENEKKEFIQKQILQIFDVKNLSFLVGAGCSSYIDAIGTEIGIPTMQGLAEDFYKEIGDSGKNQINSLLQIKSEEHQVKNDLEHLMELLLAQKFLTEKRQESDIEINSFITELKKFIQKKCLNEGVLDEELTELYKSFYRKLVYRDPNLPKVKIFTTNYDLYSEKAMDELGILYSNGFSGFTHRYFNPATFNYAYAEQMDLSNNKWNVIDNYIYLYKLHGSINWIQHDSPSGLFNIKEVQNPENHHEKMMIYPTPSKYSASFSPPYSDLFREFQKSLMQDSNALIAMGYSFSDEHINNIIYQALTIPSFRLVIFGGKTENIQKLIDLGDPRIWVIGGEIGGEKLHYFDSIVSTVLPDSDSQEISSSVEKAISKLIKQSQTDDSRQ